MRGVRFSPPFFSIGLCLAYMPVFTFDWPLFLYYPLHGAFSRTALGPESGPAMHWYGLMATAALAGLVAALIGRDSWIAEGARRWLWLVPALTMIEILYPLRVFFL